MHVHDRAVFLKKKRLFIYFFFFHIFPVPFSHGFRRAEISGRHTPEGLGHVYSQTRLSDIGTKWRSRKLSDVYIRKYVYTRRVRLVCAAALHNRKGGLANKIKHALTN